jgi:hypothetical protein
MKTPLLFDVPKTHPSRIDRVNAFKKKHDIFTHYAGRSFGKENEPWDALWVTGARKLLKGYTGSGVVIPEELIANWCRLLDEASLLLTGKTERDAIRELCQCNNIPCDL